MTQKDGFDKTLIIGIGNIGRSDDALGWMFLDRLQGTSSLQLEYRYQLQIEDAEMISRYENVVFVDAFKGNLERGFCFKACKGKKQESLNSHALLPETVVWLCKELYASTPRSFVLAIQGFNWELDIGVSDRALENLENALKKFRTDPIDHSF